MNKWKCNFNHTLFYVWEVQSQFHSKREYEWYLSYIKLILYHTRSTIGHRFNCRLILTCLLIQFAIACCTDECAISCNFSFIVCAINNNNSPTNTNPTTNSSPLSWKHKIKKNIKKRPQIHRDHCKTNIGKKCPNNFRYLVH